MLVNIFTGVQNDIIVTVFVPFADTVLLSDETGITLSDKWTTDNVITTNIAVEDQVCFK